MGTALGKTALAVLAFFFLNTGLSLLVVAAGGAYLPLFMTSPAAAVLTAAMLYTFLERDKSWTLGFRQPAWLSKGLLGLLLGSLFVFIPFLAILALGGIRVVAVMVEWTPQMASEMIWFAVVFTSVGIGEELFSRGYIYGVVKRQSGITAAVLVSAAVFALLHSFNVAVFATVFPMLNLTLAGILLALLREWSGGLWVPIGAHISWNFVQGNVLGMAVSGIEIASVLRVEAVHPLLAGGAFGLEGSFVTTVVLCAATVLLWRKVCRRPRSGGANDV